MPRTIDHIVATHQHARALRQAGRPVWKQTISIRPILHESSDRSVEHVCDIAQRIARMMRAALPATTFDVTAADYDYDLDEVIEDLESYTVEGLNALKAEGEDILALFDGRLDELYDWADKERVWLG